MYNRVTENQNKSKGIYCYEIYSYKLSVLFIVFVEETQSQLYSKKIKSFKQKVFKL